MKSITDEKLNNIINSNHLRSLSIYLEFNKKQLLELIKRKVSLKEIYNFYVNETSNNINFNSFKSRFYQFKKSFNKDDLKYLNEFTPKAVEPTSTEPKLEISSEVRAVEPTSTEPKLETSSEVRAVEPTSTEPKLETSSEVRAVEPTSTEPKLETSSEVRAIEPTSTEPKLEISSEVRAIEPTSTEPKLETSSEVRAVEPTSTEPKLEISSEVRAIEPTSTEPKLETSSEVRAVEPTSTEPKLEISSSEIETIKNLIYNTYQNKIKNLDKFYIDLNFIKELVKEIKLNIKFPTISKNYDLDLIDTYDKIELQNILNSIEYFYNYITSDLMWSFFYTSRFINYINENDFKFKSRVKQYLNKTN